MATLLMARAAVGLFAHFLVLTLVSLCVAGPLTGTAKAQEPKPAVWVFESSAYFQAVQGVAGDAVQLEHCDKPGACEALPLSARERVVAVVGQPYNVSSLSRSNLPTLKLLQSTHYQYLRLEDVPPQVAVASYSPDYDHDFGAEDIAEFVVAAMFEWNYRLGRKSPQFTSCAFAADAPVDCPPTSVLTGHPTLMKKTLGVLGYGTIGQAIARRAAGLSMRVVATRRHGPFEPPPPPLTWLSSDNDRLLRESDFVAVTLPRSVKGIVNKTGLAMMKSQSVLIPLSAPPIDYDALLASLANRSIGGAILDVWPQGCWNYPEQECGPPYGPPVWPYAQKELVALDNVIALPGVAERDDKFWGKSATFVAQNLQALLEGKSLAGVVRNSTANMMTMWREPSSSVAEGSDIADSLIL